MAYRRRYKNRFTRYSRFGRSRFGRSRFRSRFGRSTYRPMRRRFYKFGRLY